MTVELTEPQVRALEAVCSPDPLFDDVVTWRGWSDWSAAVVNARAATSLAGLGLVVLETNPSYRGNRLAFPTAEGRAVFAEIFGEPAKRRAHRG